MSNSPNRSIRTQTLLAGLLICTLFSTGCKFPFLNKHGAKASLPSPALNRTARDRHANREELKWLTSSDSAMQTAARDNKLVMALFTGSDWCPYCVKLEKEVFADDEFAGWAEQNVVPLMLDFPKRTKLPQRLAAQNESLRARYEQHIEGYPTVLFLDGQGEVVGKMGYARGGPRNWISQAESKMIR